MGGYKNKDCARLFSYRGQKYHTGVENIDVETKSLPMVALRGLTVLPEMVKHFDVSRTKSIQAIEEAMEGDQKIFLSSQIEPNLIRNSGIADVYRIGCIASIKQVVKLPKRC